MTGSVAERARQLGFAWECRKAAGKVTCAASGTDRGEYVAHMRGHGTKMLQPTVKPIRLARTHKQAPARFPAVEVPVFKFLRWTERHAEPVDCTACQHGESQHRPQHGMTGVTYRCQRCECVADPCDFPEPVRHQVERSGQFLSEGPYPHSVWVLPLEPAPWETGRAAPVTLFVIEPGRYTMDGGYAKDARRRATRVAKLLKRGRALAA